MYALVDCNNFYVSCERLFRPSLNGRAVVVLSNNDGCAISRSEEAKAAGLPMGAVPHLFAEVFRQHRVVGLSSNYTLYGDISDRVMNTLAELVPAIEVYSIDEAFLDLGGLRHTDLASLGIRLIKTIRQHIGIPVSVGIAPTRTLAKMANRYVKKIDQTRGVYYAASVGDIRNMLSLTPVEDVWGIGRQRALLLNRHGFKTALDFTRANDHWVRKHMQVTGLRLLNELRGIETEGIEGSPANKKNVATSRSFGYLVSDKGLIRQALANYTANCALKLRQQGSVARQLRVFLQTNQHRTDMPQYFRSVVIDLAQPSNQTPELVKQALVALDLIFRNGFSYKKTGVEMLDLVPENSVQSNLFRDPNGKLPKVTAALDGINRILGHDTVRFANQGFEQVYAARCNFRTPCYTTRITDIPKVNN